MSAANLVQWKPRELIFAARQSSLEDFLAECEASHLLAIRVDDPNSELALGLAAQEPRDQGRDGLGFRTVQRNVSSVVESLAELERSSQRMRGLGAQLAPLSREVLDSPRFVLPLRKRSEAAFLKSVSVGRARNHDIVLRHRSVSKFHGSFDYDEKGRLFVRDANSSNHTFVNGEKLGAPRELHAGDLVQFGSVECYLCTAEDLWRTARG
ncbi:MAG TPA: FHA domain-containing protein [Polyangiales bacterium]|nr:FHA domain-containing protein [Polyangiales bacterium]